MCSSMQCSVGPKRRPRRGNVMINRRRGIKAVKRGLLAVFLLFTASATTQAGPLGLPVDSFPSIMAGMITSSYNATTGAFVADGFAMTLDRGTGKLGITTGFKLLATIERSGTVTSASINIGNSLITPLLRGTGSVEFPVQFGYSS